MKHAFNKPKSSQSSPSNIPEDEVLFPKGPKPLFKCADKKQPEETQQPMKRQEGTKKLNECLPKAHCDVMHAYVAYCRPKSYSVSNLPRPYR